MAALGVGVLSTNPVSGHDDETNGDKEIEPLWEFEFDSPHITSPSFSGGNIILTSKEGVSIFDTDTGEETETIELEGSVPQTQPSIKGQKYVTSCTKTVNLVTLNKGEIDWSKSVDRTVSSVLIEGQKVVVGLNPSRGRINQNQGDENNKSKVLGLDLDSGSVEWELILDDPLGGSLISNGAGKIIVPEVSGQIRRIDSSGQQIWSADIGGPYVSNPSIDQGKIYAANQDGQLYSINIGSGKVTELTDINAPAKGTTLSVDSSGVTCPGRSSVEKVSKSGKTQWSVDSKTPMSSPHVAQGHVYTVSNNGVIKSINYSNGDIQWESTLRKIEHISETCGSGYNGIVGQPVRRGSKIYLSHDGGKLVALSAGKEDKQ